MQRICLLPSTVEVLTPPAAAAKSERRLRRVLFQHVLWDTLSAERSK